MECFDQYVVLKTLITVQLD